MPTPFPNHLCAVPCRVRPWIHFPFLPSTPMTPWEKQWWQMADKRACSTNISSLNNSPAVFVVLCFENFLACTALYCIVTIKSDYMDFRISCPVFKRMTWQFSPSFWVCGTKLWSWSLSLSWFVQNPAKGCFPHISKSDYFFHEGRFYVSDKACNLWNFHTFFLDFHKCSAQS